MLDIATHKFSDLKPGETEDRGILALYRLFSLIGVITYPLFYFIFNYTHPGNNDSLTLRLIMSGLCLGIFISTYSKDFFLKYLNEILYIISFCGITHFTYLLWVNNFQIFYYIGFLIVVFIFSFTFKRLIDLWVFLVFSLFIISVSALNLLDPRDAAFYIFSSGILFSVISITLTRKIQTETETSLGTYLLESLYQESPDAIIIVEKKEDKILRINKKALSLFNIINEEKYEYQPLNVLIGKDLNKSIPILELEVNGRQNIWVNIARENFSIQGEQFGIIRILDISDDKKLSDELRLKDNLLSGVTEACSSLLLKKDFNSAIKGAIKTLGKATRVDRVYVYENTKDDYSKTAFNHRYEWINDTDSFRVNRKRLQNILYETYLPRWENELRNGNTIKGNTKNFPENERIILQARGTQSLIVVPIFIEEKFSGFIGFDNCHSEQDWGSIEENILKSAAAAVSGAISKQLKEHEIVVAMEATEAASKAKESFLANVSHEIRTPMNGIIGLTQLIQKSKLDEKQSQYITAIKQSSEHLLVIINDLLDFSKIVAGQMEFENIEFDLTSLIYNINQTYGNRALDKGIYLHSDIGENVPVKLMGDPVRLNQVLVNLVGNSIKFTEQGGVTIRIKCIEEKNNSLNLRFSIEDTGIGIPADKTETIFESFKQADKDTARKYGGTGLGLSIVKKILDAQNGKIWIESEPGRGSSFIFDLTFEIPTKGNIEKVGVITYHKLKGVNILLAEDNMVNQLLANDLITEWGAEIDIADNGEIAINKLHTKKYDLILMDVQMPIVNGLDATEIIRKYSDKSISRIPIIAMTANAIKGDNDKCFAVGMNDYITKPFKPLDLNNKIWQYISAEKKLTAEGKDCQTNKTSVLEQEFTSNIINLINLKEFSRGKNDFLVKMLMLLLDQTPPAVKQIGEAIPVSDWDTVRSLAHKMKPNIGLLGNPELDALILSLEKNADAKTELDTLPKIFDEFNMLLAPALEEAKRAHSFYSSIKS